MSAIITISLLNGVLVLSLTHARKVPVKKVTTQVPSAKYKELSKRR
jgi:hypothetical protein